MERGWGNISPEKNFYLPKHDHWAQKCDNYKLYFLNFNISNRTKFNFYICYTYSPVIWFTLYLHTTNKQYRRKSYLYDNNIPNNVLYIRFSCNNVHYSTILIIIVIFINIHGIFLIVNFRNYYFLFYTF